MQQRKDLLIIHWSTFTTHTILLSKLVTIIQTDLWSGIRLQNPKEKGIDDNVQQCIVHLIIFILETSQTWMHNLGLTIDGS